MNKDEWIEQARALLAIMADEILGFYEEIAIEGGVKFDAEAAAEDETIKAARTLAKMDVE